MKNLSSIILRIGIGAVIVWFGSQQLGNPTPWIGFLPSWTNSLPISQINFVYLNGWFEVVAGICLIAGFYTRIAAFFLGLHLLGIVFSVGYSPTAIRDFGLTTALFSIFLHGESSWSMDEFLSTHLLTSQQKL